jgi:regulator of replication initiation timing
MSQPDSENIPQPERGRPGVGVSGSLQADAEALSFVERETRRRKRLLRFYLLLLAIPVAVGVAVLIFGRSDTRLVIDEIKTQAPAIVKSAVGDQIKPTIKEEVKNQISPTLGQIDSKISEVAQSSKTSLEEANKKLQAENESLKTELNNKINDVAQSRVSREELQKQNESLKTELNSSRDAAIQGISQRLGQIQTGLEGKIRVLQQRVDVLPRQRSGGINRNLITTPQP